MRNKPIATMGALALLLCGLSAACEQQRPASSSHGAVDAGAAAGAADGAAGAPMGKGILMPRISAGVPAFVSGNANGSSAANAVDDNQMSYWTSDTVPAWIALDLSRAPLTERQRVLVVWNALRAGMYIDDMPSAGDQMPTRYTIEINAAPGGGAPPTSGWTEVASASSNVRNSVETAVELGGANWVRLTVSAATDPTVALDVDVYAMPNGASDCWMMMGDSITYITMGYIWSDVPALVHQTNAARWPAVINAAIGGTNTGTALGVIDATMSGYPGRYVTLNYGTNDGADTFAANMEMLVKKVLAAGKIPVIPHMPWSSAQNIQDKAPAINAAIDALYAKYPEIVHGPDLWAAFSNRPDLIPPGDVHPNDAGQEFLRQQWAAVVAAVQ